MTTTPTPAVLALPWGIFHSPGEQFVEVHDTEGQEIAIFYYGVLGAPWDEPDPADRAKAEQRATFLCQAANAYAPLVEVLERIAEQCCDADDCFASADARAALRLADDAGEGRS